MLVYSKEKFLYFYYRVAMTAETNKSDRMEEQKIYHYLIAAVYNLAGRQVKCTAPQ